MIDPIESITKPTLILDSRRAQRNIERMAKKAERNGTLFRPHFKTHQSAIIGEWFRHQGVTKIAASSVDMANYFAGNGWEDITIAIPTNLRQVRQIDSLASQIQLNIVLESQEVARELDGFLSSKINAWLKIDAGYHRTGIPWNDLDRISILASTIEKSNNIDLAGLLTHAGRTYGAGSRERISELFQETNHRLRSIQSELLKRGLKVKISVGDTPGCSIVEDFGGVDEIRPGNFVFFDISQLRFGSCTEEDIAVGVACPVIAKHPDREQLIIYGGAIHLSKESLRQENGSEIFGAVCVPDANGWSSIFENSFVSSISQEHGIVNADEHLFDSVDVGDLLIILPVHSCLTANLLGEYTTLDSHRIPMFRY